MNRNSHYTEIGNIPEYCGIGVYRLVGSSGRVYIGSSVDVQQRIKQHCWALRNGKANRKIQKAFNNGETFTAEILHRLPDWITRGELIGLESKELRKAGGTDNTFNDAGPNTYYPADVLCSPLLALTLPEGTKDRWNAAAQQAGLSMTKYVQAVVEADIERRSKKGE